MAYDTANAQKDFEDISSEEFGEYIVYLPHGGSSRRILAVRPRTTNTKIDLKGTTYSPARKKIEILVSQGGKGVPVVQVGRDQVRMYLEPDDAFMRLLTVQSAQSEYRVWRLGLIA